MNPKTTFLLLTGVLLLLTAAPPPAAAMSPAQQKEFDRIMRLGMDGLTEESSKLLDDKYPDENWDQYNFPEFVYSSKSVEIGYKIAVKEPQVLSINRCYCFCDTMGHGSLLSCFWKDGKVGGSFDDHASGCNICYGEAMISFLTKNLGASDAEIQQGLAKKFEQWVKQHQKKQ